MTNLAALSFTIALTGISAFAQSNFDPSVSNNSMNFQVYSFPGGPDPSKFVAHCELVRKELQQLWGANSNIQHWEPKCQIVIHPTRERYTRAVGPCSGQSNGASHIQFKDGKTSCRRIDLLVDATGALSAMPHELTHIVLADQFKGRQPPAWLDEGLAMLADSDSKQELHEKDCSNAIASGRFIPLIELVRLEQCTSPEQVAVFYGQSLSFVRMLVELNRPQKIIDFGNDCLDSGYDEAFRQHYKFEGIAEAQRHWRIHANLSDSNKTKSRLDIVKTRMDDVIKH